VRILWRLDDGQGGREVVVSGPVCPEQQIVVRDGKVEPQPASANNT
jgi:hypothetical protein